MNDAPVGVRRPSALERAHERLAQAEADIAQNARERVWLWWIFVTLPVLGGVVWLALALFAGKNGTGILVFVGAVALAVVTYGTGRYMTAVRRREFEDAIRDTRAEITRLERNTM